MSAIFVLITSGPRLVVDAVADHYHRFTIPPVVSRSVRDTVGRQFSLSSRGQHCLLHGSVND